MADLTSNILEHEAEMMAFLEGFSFKALGRDESLGKDIATAAAEGIIERTVVEQKDINGQPLKANDPKYAARKLRKHGIDKVAVLTGQTMSLQSIMGKVTITDDAIEMEHGTDEPPRNFATTGTLRAEEPTDTEKGEYLTEQGREFYALDDDIAEKIYELAGEALEVYIEGF